MTTDFRLSCLIPAYNEGPRIGRVLEVALATRGIDEVIVIDDASSDDTVAVAESFAVRHQALRVLRQPANAGKTRAVARGVAQAAGTHLMLLDSDLVGLTPGALTALISPLADSKAEVSISLRGNAPAPWRWIGLDYISGERVLPRAVLADRLDALDELPRFGLEVFMNRIWIDEGFAIAVVHWPEVSSPLKSAKQGRWAGIVSDAKMLGDIFRTIPPLQILRQIVAMRRRRVAPIAPPLPGPCPDPADP